MLGLALRCRAAASPARRFASSEQRATLLATQDEVNTRLAARRVMRLMASFARQRTLRPLTRTLRDFADRSSRFRASTLHGAVEHRLSWAFGRVRPALDDFLRREGFFDDLHREWDKHDDAEQAKKDLKELADDPEGAGDVEGGAVYDDDIDWTKVKRTPKGKAPPLPLLGAGVCAAWLCLTTARTVGRYEAFVACCVAYGALFSTYLRKWIAKRSGGDSAMRAISQPIADGAAGFLRVQYAAIFRLAAPLAAAIGLSYKLRPPPRGAAGAAQAVSRTTLGCVASCCFLVGAGCSALSGYAAMRVASHANVRVADAAKRSAADALVVCFRGGAFSAVLNLTLCIVGVLVLFGVIHMAGVVDDAADVPLLLVGYGFGASFVALFMQLGGGIYTKAADVGADLVGKVEQAIPEDDPRNPATIADNVGDNVGDVAGMGADLFESYVGSIIAAATLAKRDNEIALPFWLSACGVVAAMIGTMAVSTNEKGEGWNSNLGALMWALEKGTMLAGAIFLGLGAACCWDLCALPR